MPYTRNKERERKTKKNITETGVKKKTEKRMEKMRGRMREKKKEKGERGRGDKRKMHSKGRKR